MTPEEKAKIERMLAWDNMDRDSGLYKAGWNEALEEAATFVEENYEESFTNVVGNQSWRERGPRKLAAAVRALKDHSPQQDSS